MRFICVCFIFLYPLLPQTSYAQHSQIAIVIDDIGYRITDKHALTLPGEITYSVLPHTPFGQTLAKQAYANNKDVLLHIPMESSIGKKLGPGALTSEMTEIDIQHQLQKAFEEVPFAIGINNHMGSKLTQLYSPMAWTMRFLKQRNAIFLDSLTTQKSKGVRVAKLFGVPSLHRHVFLDNQLTESYITQQFKQLINIAQTQQRTIAIAHPHPKTITVLTKLIPTLAQYNIKLVPLSHLFNHNNYNRSETLQLTE